MPQNDHLGLYCSVRNPTKSRTFRVLKPLLVLHHARPEIRCDFPYLSSDAFGAKQFLLGGVYIRLCQNQSRMFCTRTRFRTKCARLLIASAKSGLRQSSHQNRTKSGRNPKITKFFDDPRPRSASPGPTPDSPRDHDNQQNHRDCNQAEPYKHGRKQYTPLLPRRASNEQ
jgi:hypothetical protein